MLVGIRFHYLLFSVNFTSSLFGFCNAMFMHLIQP